MKLVLFVAPLPMAGLVLCTFCPLSLIKDPIKFCHSLIFMISGLEQGSAVGAYALFGMRPLDFWDDLSLRTYSLDCQHYEFVCFWLSFS